MPKAQVGLNKKEKVINEGDSNIAKGSKNKTA
jgi:hypothetical protein